MKERFTDEEWTLLKYLPYHIFVMILGTDTLFASSKRADKIVRRIYNSAYRIFAQASELHDPLTRELFKDMLSEGQARATSFEESYGSETVPDSFQIMLYTFPSMDTDGSNYNIRTEKAAEAVEIKALLRQQLSPEEYQDFMKNLIIFGLTIAKVSGSIFTRGRATKRETNVLNRFASLYEFDNVLVGKGIL
ncbi:MAG: hypothetical protein WC891_02185 [Actinomycetota bacterium]